MLGAMAIVFVLVFAASAGAGAQDGAGWVVAVATAGGDAEAARRTSQRALEHLEAEGQSVLSGPALDERVASAISRPFVPLGVGEQERVATVADATLQLVTFGDDAGAQRSSAAAIRDIEPRLAAAGREDATATRIGDICLYAVRAQLHARQVDAARQQALRCVALVPDLAPPAGSHPADVRRLVDEARAEIARGGRQLEVAVDGAADSCVVRAQGRRVASPAALPAGRYQVQVECRNEPGRIHDIVLADASVRLEVDETLEAALGNRDGLLLRYASEDMLRQRAARHVQAIGSALRVANVLLVRDDAGDAVALERFAIERSGARRVAAARIALSADERVPPAINALMAGRSVDLEAASQEPPVSDDGPTRADDEDSNTLGPLLVGGAGIVALALVLGAAVLAPCDEEYSDGTCARGSELNPPVAIGVGVAGGLAIVGGALWYAFE